MPPDPTRVLVIGLGNESRGDDAIGRVLARRLKINAPETATILEHSGDAGSLLDILPKADTVILIDAANSGVSLGTVHRFDGKAAPLPACLGRGSTHAFGVAEAVELARALNQLPRRLMVYAIEGRNFDLGTGLAPELEEALPELERRLREEIGRFCRS